MRAQILERSATLLAPALALALAVAVLPAPSAATPASLQVTIAQSRAVDVDPAVAEGLRSGAVTVVVRTHAGALDEVARAAVSAGAEMVADLQFINAFAATIDATVLDMLVARRDVIAISADREAEYQGKPPKPAPSDPPPPSDAPPKGDSWFEQTIQADVLRAMGIDGTGVRIAILDSGIANHPTTKGRVVAGVDLSGEGDGIDHHGHGTFLSGIAAGNGATSPSGAWDGVAPGATVIPVKIGGQNGVSLVALLQGLQWIHFNASAQGIRVVNMSFGTNSSQSFTIDPLNFAVQQLWSDGIVVVVAAGNLGADGSRSITKPGDDPFVITVGSLDSMGTVSTKDDTIPNFSGRGPTRADGLAKPDIVAPGRSLIGPVAPGSAVAAMTAAHVADGWVRASGTSMSTAVVSGAVALLLQANPRWTPNQVKGALLDSATPGPVGNPNIDGHGIVNVAAAAQVKNPTNYNAGIPFGTGTGSLDATLGTVSQPLWSSSLALPSTIAVVTNVTTCLLRRCKTVSLTVEVAASSLEFFTTQRYISDFAAKGWSSTQWEGNQWYGNQWYGNQWYGNQWYGNQWYGNQWYGNQFSGNQWYGNQWYGNQWYGNQWYGDTWS